MATAPVAPAGPGAAAVDEFRTPRPIAGWRIVFTTFCMALVAWGLGFYSLSVYVQYLSQQGRFSAGLGSAAPTYHFGGGAAALYAVDAAVARFGRRRVVMGGVVAMAGCASALAYVPNAFWLFAAYAGMAFGWAAISGTAITQIIGSWFDHKRGLALNVGLTGASAAGFVVVPALVWAIGRFGLGVGVASTAMLLALVLLGLLAVNLVEPAGVALPLSAPLSKPASPSAAGTATPPGALPIDRHLLLLCALFGIGWLAQVAFLAQQLPLLVPKIGATQATIAVAATTASSLLGRLLLASFMDRIDHRHATAASFGSQALGMLLMLATNEPLWVIAGCCLVGASVGNVITLPAMFAQREFAAAHYAQVITRIWSVGQVMYAFGPMGAGLMISATGASTGTLLACMACQGLAVALCFVRPGARGP
jgi:MFS family permease